MGYRVIITEEEGTRDMGYRVIITEEDQGHDGV